MSSVLDNLWSWLAENGRREYDFRVGTLGADQSVGLGAAAARRSESLGRVIHSLQASVDQGTAERDWAGRLSRADIGVLQVLGRVPRTYDGLAKMIGYADLEQLMAEGELSAGGRDIVSRVEPIAAPITPDQRRICLAGPLEDACR